MIKFRFWLPVGVFALFIGALLLFEHRSHIPNDYIFVAVILGLCLGVHFFMHGGHGGHSESKAPPNNDNNRDKK
ncbi:MAG: DUF2933 domain-containing protein [Robiginitomaculum sp.]|nr:DUF2933 domain-containing protein [Robiginitomaculum sp.]